MIIGTEGTALSEAESLIYAVVKVAEAPPRIAVSAGHFREQMALFL
jgi:hypothetical protein